MIDLYTWGTPNGRKVSIMLEACGLPYRFHRIDISAGDQFKPEFLAISPNNRIPAITDTDGPDGKPVSVFESGAILLYLAEKTGRYLPADPREKIICMEWLMWQMGGFGPMLGQAHHFNRFAKEDVPYGKQRYTAEAKRLWGVLDKHLADKTYICGANQSIADFAIYPWACRYEWQTVELNDFPAVHRWMQRLATEDYITKGMQIPDNR
ncbi:glutathione S-transferase N-terminal domain-containing protein [Aliamphritea spongicola]|uniref:glutathione S-transferase N-terminal domain-containing protein n=1 Tax=Aliamphritea spongicola TaxID=707589 RepID=UPI00196A3A9F|nr:glutathione S-transferase N-terminal domain-containing protein [Aliamphritea spongicola]MBN3561795.1 glutathione S-transferase N-terminal domain-containing protein [Aliamphritea spongicola]